MTEKDTKHKILEVANELFAKNGFGGTSVRDIAAQAEVNLAAINYHFKNKENLYKEVFDYNYDLMAAAILKAGNEAEDTVELAVKVYREFVSSGSCIMNIFKIFLTDNVNFLDEGTCLEDAQRVGPPGQEIFFEKIKNDLGDNIPADALSWATKVTFSLLIHFGVIMNTSIMKAKCQVQDELKPQAIEDAIVHAVRSHMAYLKANPTLSRI